LAARALAGDEERPGDALAIVKYHQRRNHAAYRSHRQRTLNRHRYQRSTARKGKVSE